MDTQCFFLTRGGKLWCFCAIWTSKGRVFLNSLNFASVPHPFRRLKSNNTTKGAGAWANIFTNTSGELAPSAADPLRGSRSHCSALVTSFARQRQLC